MTQGKKKLYQIIFFEVALAPWLGHTPPHAGRRMAAKALQHPYLHLQVTQRSPHLLLFVTFPCNWLCWPGPAAGARGSGPALQCAPGG